MTPFARVQRDAASSMIERAAMLALPCEFFQRYFGGRVPSLAEKAFFVEATIQRMTAPQIFQNDIYQVEVSCAPPMIHLDIRRRDTQRCAEWRELQQIKNELVGPEYEAVQLFPAESRLAGTGTEYHLWVYADPTAKFELGFKDRFVIEGDETVPPRQ